MVLREIEKIGSSGSNNGHKWNVLKEYIMKKLKLGHYQIGDLLPSENRLAMSKKQGIMYVCALGDTMCRHFWGCLFCVLVILLLPYAALATVDVYVSPDGDNNQPGTREKPFQTLKRARQAVRQLRVSPEEPTETVTIWLEPGTYVFRETFALDQRDSGTAQHPVVYRASQPGRVRIIGGRDIPLSAVQPVTEAKILDRIIETPARQHVRQVDLRAIGVTDYGQMRPRGFRRPYINPGLELFINGCALQLARWPNEGVVPVGEVLDRGSIPRGSGELVANGDYSNRGGTFRYDYDRPQYWSQAEDIWISGFFCHGYADDTVKIASIDAENRTITTGQAHMYGFASGKPWRAYHALNLLEEIDQPGEYFVDRHSGILYFYPPADRIKTIAVSLLDGPMVAMQGASHITLRDLTFEVSRGIGIYMERGTSNLIAGCTLRNLGVLAVCVGMGVEPDTIYRHNFTGKPCSRQLGSWHEHIYENSTFDRQAGTNHGIVSCDIYNTGAGGISLGGGDRKTLTPAGNYVRNCDIYNNNRLDRSYKASVNIDGVGNRIEHCDMHDTPGGAIYLHGNDHIIEYNHVYRTCLDADDMGVFYMGRDPSEQGNIIRHNYFHNNGNDHGGRTCILYFDDDACGTAVIGNVFYHNKGDCGWINGGADHVYRNNIFVENPRNVYTGRWQLNYNWRTSPIMKKRLLEDLDITQPPYATRYPRLLESFNKHMDADRGQYIWHNVSYRSGRFGGGTYILKNNLATSEDPGFVDPGDMNFQLRDDSIVYRKIPEFEKIPFEKIGLYQDAFRRKLPVRPIDASPSPPKFSSPTWEKFVGRTTVALQAAGNTDIYYTLNGTAPTKQSQLYTGLITLTDTTTIRTFAVRQGDQRSCSKVVSRTFERMVNPLLTTDCRVNFQSASAPRPEGFLVDVGKPFGTQDQGCFYGWNQDNQDASRYRNINPDLLRDTLVHFASGVVWEIALKNGTYDVTVCVGDSEWPTNRNTIIVEDMEFCRDVKLGANQFEVYTRQVTVRDGVLTIRSNDEAPANDQGRINYAEMHRRPQ